MTSGVQLKIISLFFFPPLFLTHIILESRLLERLNLHSKFDNKFTKIAYKTFISSELKSITISFDPCVKRWSLMIFLSL